MLVWSSVTPACVMRTTPHKTSSEHPLHPPALPELLLDCHHRSPDETAYGPTVVEVLQRNLSCEGKHPARGNVPEVHRTSAIPRILSTTSPRLYTKSHQHTWGRLW